jgi:hypothetical protein
LKVPAEILNEDGTPFDLTGWTVTLTVADDASGEPEPVISLNSEPGGAITITDPATDGKCEVIFEKADTAALAPGTYKYDVKVTKDTEQHTAVYDAFTVLPVAWKGV